MNLVSKLTRPPWRIVVPAAGLLVLVCLGYLLWTPGLKIEDGRHDRGRNAMWISHRWLGDDGIDYHSPGVENIRNALLGIHRGLSRLTDTGPYQGVAIYCEWETDPAEWRLSEKWFLKF